MTLSPCFFPGCRMASIACLLLFGTTTLAVAADKLPDPLAEAKSAMQAEEFKEAVESLDGLLKADLPKADEAIYLKARAQYALQRYTDCLATVDTILSEYAKSPWIRKARFLKARALVSLRRYQEAEVTYQEETQRLLSKTRKQKIANVILSFADALAKKPDPQDVGAPPPDYAKAYKLYGKVLEMEIARPLRDTVTYRRAHSILLAENYPQAINEFQAYLAKFDPDWTGNVGSVTRMSGRKRESTVDAGKHIFEARYQLVKAQLQANQRDAARTNAEDLLKQLANSPNPDAPEQKQLEANTAWLLVQTYGMPQPTAKQFEKAIQVTREFLTTYPGNSRSVEGAGLLPEAYRHLGRADEAIAEYQNLIDGRGFTPPTGDAATDKLDDLKKSPAELLDQLRKTALFQIGQIRFSQKQYPKAIAVWNQYIGQFPNGPNWSDCQRGIVDAEYQAAVDLVSEEKYLEACKRFDTFLTEHPLDKRAPEILFLIGQIDYVAAQQLEKQEAKRQDVVKAYQKAVDRWQRLVSKYPNTEPSSLALYRIGIIHEEKLGNLEQAIQSYRRLTWGSAATTARARVAKMTEKHLKLSTERTFRTNDPVLVKLETRNVKKLTVKQYSLDLEAYFRKTHEVGRIDTLDIDLIAPDKTWEIELDGYAEYAPLTQTLEVPFEDHVAGVCLIHVSNEDLQATTLVIRSDLELIVKSSRRELLVFVQNMLKNTPASKVKLLISDGQQVFATGQTDSDGIFRGQFKQLKGTKKARVFAIQNGSIASNLLDLSGLHFSTGLSPKGYLYTNRPAYQPGQAVKFRGILRSVKNGQYHAPAGDEYQVSLVDSSGRLLWEKFVTLSDFGTLHGQFPLDQNVPLGEYQLIVSKKKGPTYSSTFQVQQFTLQKMELALTTDRQVYFRGEKATLTIDAHYYWGQPVAERPIRYRLPDGRTLVEKTDSQGKLMVTFDTSGIRAGRLLHFSATLEGENVATQTTAMLAARGYQISVKPHRTLTLAGEPMELEIETKAPDGSPVGRSLTLMVLRRAVLRTNQVLQGVPWNSVNSHPAEETTVMEQTVKTDDKTGKATVRLQDKSLALGGEYVLRVSGEDRFKQVVSGEARVRVSDDEDATKLRFFAPKDTLQVGQPAKLRIHSRIDATLALLTIEGETLISYRVLPLHEGFNPIELQIDHQHFPNFRVSVALIDGQHLRSAHKPFRVERLLQVKVKPLATSYPPGSPGKVELTVTDQLGKPVRGEFSLSLVDEAIFAAFPDATMSIRDFFQKDATRSAEFREASSCGFHYSASTRKVLPEFQEEMQRLTLALSQTQSVSTVVSVADGGTVLLGGIKRLNSMAESEPTSGKGRRGGRESQLGRALGGTSTTNAPMNKNGKVPFSEDVARQELAGGKHFSMDGSLRISDSREQRSEGARRELLDAGWWMPAIVTDDAGKAIVEIPMPDTTTQWRLTARGTTVETLVGQATANVLTRQDFFVTLKMPQQLREGDTTRILVRVHNLTDYAGDVELTFTLFGGDNLTHRLAKRSLHVKVDKQSTTERLFDAVNVPSTSELKFQVEAIAGDMSDRLARTIPVHPWGLEFADQAGGVSRGDATAYVQLPEGRKYQTRWMTVSVGAHLQHSLIDMALGGSRVEPVSRPAVGRCNYPAPPPWGQLPGSDLLAVVAARDYARSVKAPQVDVERLTQQARSLVSALVVSQRDDGGWNWQGNHKQTDWAVSALNFWALCEAKQQGFAVHPDAFSKAQDFLENRFTQLSQNDNDAKALVLHALSCNEAADFAHVNRLYRERNSLSAPALAYTALTFANLGRNDFASELLSVLETKAKPTETGTHWDGSDKHAWTNDPLETTAVATLAMMKAQPDSKRIPEAIQYLMHQHGVWGFTPAKAKGPAIAALCQFHQKGQYAKTDYQLSISINGQLLKAITSRDTQGVVLLAVPPELLVDGKNQVDFQMTGDGQFSYGATLRGFSDTLEDPKSWSYPSVRQRRYLHAPLEYRGRPIGAASSSPVKNIEVGQRVHVQVDLNDNNLPTTYLIVEEPLPAGMMLVEGSLTGLFDYYCVRDGRILMYYRPGQQVRDFRYELISFASGTYRVLPTVIRDVLHPQRMRVGKSHQLTVLEPDQKSNDPYAMNDGERFALGKLAFEDGLYAKAAPYLRHLAKHNRNYRERDVAKMLLWIYTSDEFYDAQQIVVAFEVLRERYPTLEIPFDKILMIGRAYRDLGEFERAYQVHRATIDASFVNDSNVSAILEDEGQFLGSIDYQEDLWYEYPDTATVVSAYFALSQALYQKAPEARLLAKQERQIARNRGDRDPQRTPDKVALLKEAVRVLSQFLTLYSDDPLADDAAFSMANALLDLKQYPQVVQACCKYEQQFDKSDFLTGFQYMTALGHFWQKQNEQALDAAKIVAEGTSKDRDLARYIIGQIYHAENDPKDAIAWYRKVASQYADAQQAIDYFEAKRITIDEINVFRPKEPVEITIKYRNIAEARCQVYRVDLMRLYLREKNLTNVTQVNLAGIQPLVEKTIRLGDGKDYIDKQQSVTLDLKQEGAYLVICRGDDLFTSALVLVTPLEIEVQEDRASGRVRANVINATTTTYIPEVHVKAIGSADSEFRSGETDLRGIFVANNLRGTTTVIARQDSNRYAFYRGDTWLGLPKDAPTAKSTLDLDIPFTQQGSFDYQENLRGRNTTIQNTKVKLFDAFRRAPNKGVEVQHAQ